MPCARAKVRVTNWVLWTGCVCNWDIKFWAWLSDGPHKLWLRSANTFRVNGLIEHNQSYCCQTISVKRAFKKSGHITATQPEGYNDRRTDCPFGEGIRRLGYHQNNKSPLTFIPSPEFQGIRGLRRSTGHRYFHRPRRIILS